MPEITAPVTVYALVDAGWTLLSDAMSAQSGSAEWGIDGNGPLDRLAGTGEFRFALKNSTGLYTPNVGSALAGWGRGTPIKLQFTYDSETYVRFYGVVDTIEIKMRAKEKLAFVTVLDWMNYAQRHPIVNPGVLQNVLGNNVMQNVYDLMAIKPLNTDFETGTENFGTAFDVITSTTTAYNEFARAVFGELGYVYLRKDKYNGETLVFEANTTRNGWAANGRIPVLSTDSAFALNEDTGFELNEDDGKVILNETQVSSISDSDIINWEAVYGDQIINRFTTRANPRRIDTSAQILFQLETDTTIAVASGQTVTIKGTYADPAGGNAINGQSMIDPVITTDYLMNTAEDGSGSNISSSLTLTSIVYGTEGFTHQVTNTNASTGYITKYNCRGYGIYLYNPVEYTTSDSVSINSYETQSGMLDQKYKNLLYSGRVFADSVVDEFKNPHIVLKSVTFCANASSRNMMEFLNTDVGDLREIMIDELNIDSQYYIQGVSAQMQGGIIFVTWRVKEHLSARLNLTPLSIEFANHAAIDYGYLPKVANIKKKTIAMWFRPTVDTTGQALMANYASQTGWQVHAVSSVVGKPEFAQVFSTTPGVWRTTNNELTARLNTWVHLAITYDFSTTTNDPIFYINGASVAVTEGTTPVGNTTTEDIGNRLVLGNLYDTGTGAFGFGFAGRIFDPRIYRRILTATEIATIYNSGTPSDTVGSTDLLYFQGFYARAAQAQDYIDATYLDTTFTLRENMYGQVGAPHPDSNAPQAFAQP